MSPGLSAYAAFLRAVNVGGTGALPMQRLRALCDEAGLLRARTYINSGNVVFESASAEASVRQALENALAASLGKPVAVLVRPISEVAQVLAGNPFPDRPPRNVVALFTDAMLPDDPLAGATGRRNEEVRLGARALYIFYPDGIGGSRLRLPCERNGTARNMNTIAKIARSEQ